MLDFYNITPPERIAKINSFYGQIYHRIYNFSDIQNPRLVGGETDTINLHSYDEE